MQLNYERKLQVDQAVVKIGSTLGARPSARTVVCAWKMQIIAAEPEAHGNWRRHS